MNRSLRLAALVLTVSLLSVSLAAAASSTYKGIVGTDKSQKLSFKVKGGKVKSWKATIYGTCPLGGQLLTVVVPSAKITDGKFKTKYQPVKSSETFITLAGKVKGSKASGTVKQTGSCGFDKVKWSAKR